LYLILEKIKNNNYKEVQRYWLGRGHTEDLILNADVVMKVQGFQKKVQIVKKLIERCQWFLEFAAPFTKQLQ
jgi:UDP-N-acetylmuramoylalanine--D-glutamate ligase